jgi:hypothetical protein
VERSPRSTITGFRRWHRLRGRAAIKDGTVLYSRDRSQRHQLTRGIRLPALAALFPGGMPPRRHTSKDTPAKLAAGMRRRWRVVLLRSKGQLLGYVEAADQKGAEATAADQFKLDAVQRKRLLLRPEA